MENQVVNSLPQPAGMFKRIFASRWVRFILAGAAVLILVMAGLYAAMMIAWANPSPNTYGVALADLDGDGDLDAFFANGQSEGPRPNTVLFNQGAASGGLAGTFKDSGQRLGREESKLPVLADLDGDGDLDAWVVNMGYQTLYMNDGQGKFSMNAQLIQENIGGTGLWDVALGDMDSDGDLDAVGAGCCGATAFYGEGKTEVFSPFNVVWFNQGGRQADREGRFVSTHEMPSLGAAAVALGDLDGDGDLDAFFGNDWFTQTPESHPPKEIGEPDTVWINPGDGMLTDSGQRLGSARAQDVALGDLDGDGDLDAFVANSGADEVWLNNGLGMFTDSGQRLGSVITNQVFLSDLDGDADLDALLVVQYSRHVEVWINDGRGNFTDSGQRIINPIAQAFTLGDIDGDGDADLFAGWYDAGHAVWRNRGNGTFTP